MEALEAFDMQKFKLEMPHKEWVFLEALEHLSKQLKRIEELLIDNSEVKYTTKG